MIKLTDILREVIRNTLKEEEYTTNKYDNVDDIVELNKYEVNIHTETDTEVYETTFDYDEALESYEFWNIYELDYKPDRLLDHDVELRVNISYYRFILSGEDIEDYPIEYSYDDEDIYELVDDGYYKTLKYRSVKGINRNADELLSKLQNYFNYEYGGRSYKYIDIMVETEDGDTLGYIQLRLSNHTGNLENIRRYSSSVLAQLSVVVSDQDPTSKKFFGGTGYYGDVYVDELEYSGEDLEHFDDVVSEIEDRIEEIKEMLLEKNTEQISESSINQEK